MAQFPMSIESPSVHSSRLRGAPCVEVPIRELASTSNSEGSFSSPSAMTAPRKISGSYSTSPDLHSLAIHNHDRSDRGSYIFHGSSCDDSSCDRSLSSTSNISHDNNNSKPAISRAKGEWDRPKAANHEENEFIDKLMESEGLEQFKQQDRRFTSARFSIVQGNPSTDQPYKGSGSNSVSWRRGSRSPSPPCATHASRNQPIPELSIDTEIQPVMKKSTSESWEPAASPVPQNPQARVDANQFCGENDVGNQIVAEREEGVSDSVWVQVQKAIEDEKTEQDTLKSLYEDLQKAGDARAQGTADEMEKLELSYNQARAFYNAYTLRLRNKRKIQRALEKTGRCPLGYAWRRDVGGYRCAGGSHFVTDEEINYMEQYED